MRHKLHPQSEDHQYTVLVCIIIMFLALALTACANKAWYQSYGFDSREDVISIASVPVLIDALGDQDPSVRKKTARALEEIGSDAKDAVPALTEVLKDNDFNVRQAAADALEAIELMGISGKDDEAKRKVRLLVNTTRLEIDNWMIRLEAVNRLADLGHEAADALPELISIIEDRSDWRDHYYNQVLKGAVIALGNIGPEARAANPALIKLMDNKDYEIRLEVVKALGKIGPGTDTAVREALIEAVHGDPELIGVRDAFASMLPSSQKDLAYTNMHFGDPDSDVRKEAAAVLGRFEADAVAAVPALLEATMTDINADVRRQAALSLSKIQPGGGAAMIAFDKALTEKEAPMTRAAAVFELRNAMPEYRESWMPRLLLCLDDVDEGVRLNAVKTLGEFKIVNKNVYKALRRLALEDKSLTVKAEAGRTLNYLKSVHPAD